MSFFRAETLSKKSVFNFQKIAAIKFRNYLLCGTSNYLKISYLQLLKL